MKITDSYSPHLINDMGTMSRKSSTVKDYSNYLTRKYGCLTPGKNAAVSVTGGLLQKAMSDEKTGAWLEKEESEAAGGDSHAKLLSVKSTADSLKEAADALQSNKLWEKKEIVNKDEETGEERKTFDYDWDAITKAVKSFVDAYNNTLERAGSSDTKDVLMVGSWMAKMTSKNANVLARAGIEIGTDNKMTLNEEKLKNNAGTAQFIFKGYNSFADKISYKASQMSQGAARSAEKMGAAYNKKGEYTGGLSSSIKDKVDEATGKKKSNITTANTDKVDQEIKNLKSKRDSLKQKINSEYNTEKRREYEKELKQIENELAVKDTEQYRKNNSVFF